jgi:hypothetical protein
VLTTKDFGNDFSNGIFDILKKDELIVKEIIRIWKITLKETIKIETELPKIKIVKDKDNLLRIPIITEMKTEKDVAKIKEDSSVKDVIDIDIHCGENYGFWKFDPALDESPFFDSPS